MYVGGRWSLHRVRAPRTPRGAVPECLGSSPGPRHPRVRTPRRSWVADGPV